MLQQHYVTVYYEEGSNTHSKALTKEDVQTFISRHKALPTILVCDPKNRTTTNYNYGKIKN